MKKDHMLVTIITRNVVSPMDTEGEKVMVPLYNIPMMSDEEWERLAVSSRSGE